VKGNLLRPALRDAAIRSHADVAHGASAKPDAAEVRAGHGSPCGKLGETFSLNSISRDRALLRERRTASDERSKIPRAGYVRRVNRDVKGISETLELINARRVNIRASGSFASVNGSVVPTSNPLSPQRSKEEGVRSEADERKRDAPIETRTRPATRMNDHTRSLDPNDRRFATLGEGFFVADGSRAKSLLGIGTRHVRV